MQNEKTVLSLFCARTLCNRKSACEIIAYWIMHCTPNTLQRKIYLLIHAFWINSTIESQVRISMNFCLCFVHLFPSIFSEVCNFSLFAISIRFSYSFSILIGCEIYTCFAQCLCFLGCITNEWLSLFMKFKHIIFSYSLCYIRASN